MNPADAFRRARDFLQSHREDWAAARGFTWPALDRFNWALDWFDVLADGNGRTALHIVEDYGAELTLSYHELAERSNRVAAWLRRHGVERGHRLLMMLPNCVQIWEVMLASMKLGAVVIPATSLLTPEDSSSPARWGAPCRATGWRSSTPMGTRPPSSPIFGNPRDELPHVFRVLADSLV